MGKPRARGAYFADPLLLPRVQEYADEQLSGTSLTSVDDLQFALRDVDGICAAYRKLPVKGRTLIYACITYTAIVEYLLGKHPRSYARKSRPVLARSVAKGLWSCLFQVCS